MRESVIVGAVRTPTGKFLGALRAFTAPELGALVIAEAVRRAGIDPDDAWRMFTSGEAMMLARLAGCERSAAAQILAAFEPMSGAHSAERFIDRFDGIDEATADERRRWLRLDPHYRAARTAIERANG